MLLGYNTNGFAHHRLEDAFAILHEIGYRAVAVTIERDLLDPPNGKGVARAVEILAPLVDRFGMHIVVETGSRFILDPRRKHQPTLVSGREEDRRRRVEFQLAAVELASRVGSSTVSLWSGSPDDGAGWEECASRLQSGLRELLEHCDERKVRLAFEPEPGMLIETMAQLEQLHGSLNHPRFGLTLDVGHVHCLSDGDIGEHVHRWGDRLWNVHIEDMRRGVHEHLMFGEGDMNFDRMFAALREVKHAGPLNVELSRHSHNAVNVALGAFEFLKTRVDKKSK